MNINRRNLNAFRNSFENSVKDLEEHYGVKLELGRITFTNHQFSGKLTVINVDDPSTNLEEVKFGNLCTKYGFTKSDYNRTVMVNGKKFKLIGFKPRATRYPCLVENDKGQYKMGTYMVKNGLI